MPDSTKPLQGIVELIGQTGSGKTTLATILGEELSPASVLFIDASPDQRLTMMLAPKFPELTLGRLFSQRTEATGSREAIDWAFHDLTVPAGEDHELLTVGILPEEVGLAEREKLRYGLNRLIENYHYIIVDGHHPLLRQLLPDEYIRILDIVTPDSFPEWQLPKSEAGMHTPAMILNRYSSEPLPPRLDEALTNQHVQLIGKLPRYDTQEDCIRKLSDDFQNCLLRLNLPLNLSSK